MPFHGPGSSRLEDRAPGQCIGKGVLEFYPLACLIQAHEKAMGDTVIGHSKSGVENIHAPRSVTMLCVA